ncbi:MAG: hypothetical protein U0903_01110 [Planctomycetales bacterium]
MATREELAVISKQFDILVITIEDLIRYRRSAGATRDPRGKRHADGVLGNARMIAYKVNHEDQQPLAIVFGDLAERGSPTDPDDLLPRGTFSTFALVTAATSCTWPWR